MNTEREPAYWDEWDEPALRRIIQQQRNITEASKKLEMKKLYQVLIIIDDYADSPRPTAPLTPRPAHADQHLGELSEAEAHQRRRAGEHAIPLLLKAAQPARAGRRHRGAQRAAAEGAARASDTRTLQFPVRLLPEVEEGNVLQALQKSAS